MFGAPPGAETLVVSCKCGATYPVPWHRKLDEELTEQITPDGSVFAPAQIKFRCLKCDNIALLDLPIHSGQYRQLAFFGDEASRQMRPNITMNVYALVAFDQADLPQIHLALDKAKHRIWPNKSPTEWVLHAGDTRIMEWRRERGIDLPTWKINEILSELCAAIGSDDISRIISVTVLPPCETKEPQSAIDELMLAVSIFAATDRSTSRGFSPRFHLEATTLDHEKNHIDYMVERVSRGLRTSLPFLYVSRGIAIGLPSTIPKGVRPELELADLIAFVACRHVFRESTGKNVEIPVDQLGTIYWNVVGPNGFRSDACRGLPWNAAPGSTSE